MDKKVGVSILFSFLVLVGLIGVSNAIINSSDSADMLRSANMTIYGDGFGIDNTTKGGVSEIVNITVLAGTITNISNITISWVGNYTFDGWVSKTDAYHQSCDAEGSGEEGQDCTGTSNATFNNVTIMNGDTGDWTCLNLSTTRLNCYNNTWGTALNGLGGNSSILIRFNVTATASIEDRAEFNITVNDDVVTRGNNTVLTAFVDGVGPTMVELNISDGNTTWNNGSFNGTDTGTYLASDSDLIVTATFHELSPHTGNVMWLFYNGSEVSVDEDLLDAATQNAVRVTPSSVTHSSLTNLVDGKYTHPIKYTWTIPANSVEDFGDGDANSSLAFAIVANDTFNNEVYLNDTSSVNGALMPFSIMLNDTMARLHNISFKDARGNTVFGGTTGFLSQTNITIEFEVTGYPLPSSVTSENNSEIFLYYNTTGSMDARANGIFNNFDRIINLTETNQTAMEDNVTLINPIDKIRYQTSMDMAGNDTNTVEVYIGVGNASIDLGHDTNQNLPGNYTALMGPYRIAIDGGLPDVSLNTPSNRGITTSESIEYVCTGTDGISGVASYTWTLIKPNGDTMPYTKVTVGTNTNTKTFSGSEIGAPGTYSVKCEVIDSVGNARTATTNTDNHFTVSVASSGGGGSGSASTVSFDIDFTDSPKATLKAAQGRIKSFSFDGATKHTITFNEVTATTATLIIASDPVTVQLNVGQSKEVDVNNDGVSDMKVTLNSIANSVADITVEKVEAGAEAIKKEEREARGLPPTEGGDVTPVAKGGLSGLWWALLVIAAIVVIGYFVSKRK